jgi:hypothetical protein
MAWKGLLGYISLIVHLVKNPHIIPGNYPQIQTISSYICVIFNTASVFLMQSKGLTLDEMSPNSQHYLPRLNIVMAKLYNLPVSLFHYGLFNISTKMTIADQWFPKKKIHIPVECVSLSSSLLLLKLLFQPCTCLVTQS